MTNLVSFAWNKFKLHTKKITQVSLFKEARTRILFWYIILMLFFVAAAIPATRQRLYARVSHRVKADMNEEVLDFEKLLSERLLTSKMENKLPTTHLVTTQQDEIKEMIYDIFDEFISSRLIEDDNYLIAIVDGEFYKCSPRVLPAVIRPNSELMEQWKVITEAKQGEKKVPNPEIGSIVYQAVPIQAKNETFGVFIVAHATWGERKEVVEALNVIIDVLSLILAIALFLAWFAAGIILAPIRQLADTVKSVDELDLSQRIKIQGKGELADLGNTFNEMMSRLENSFAAQRNFINDAGHELRTPITIICGHLELMGEDPEEQKETIEIVMDELRRMNRLVADLILLAKAERPDFLQPEVINIACFTEELFTKIKALGKRKWSLEKNVVLGTMIGDRQRLTQAIINLANNAVQHTNPDSSISLGSSWSRNQVEFWICDRGEGIALLEQKRIFDRFARVKNTPRRSEGSGLGLSIVRAIVEAHGGQVNLSSHLGVGSTFTLVLPLRSNLKILHNEANFNN